MAVRNLTSKRGDSFEDLCKRITINTEESQDDPFEDYGDFMGEDFQDFKTGQSPDLSAEESICATQTLLRKNYIYFVTTRDY